MPSDVSLPEKIAIDHAYQVLVQCFVTRCNFAMYVMVTEVGIICAYVVAIDTDLSTCVTAALENFIAPCVRWAHDNSATPSSCTDEQRTVFETNIGFWRAPNAKVGVTGPHYPVKLFRHRFQEFYSKTKVGVHDATRYQATMRSSTSHFCWETKMISQTLKTLIVKAFTLWSMIAIHERGETSHVFRALIITVCFSTMWRLSLIELITHAEGLDAETARFTATRTKEVDATVYDAERTRILLATGADTGYRGLIMLV